MLSHVKSRERICSSTVCCAVAFVHELTYSPGCWICHCCTEVVLDFHFCGGSHTLLLEFVQMNVAIGQHSIVFKKNKATCFSKK